MLTALAFLPAELAPLLVLVLAFLWMLGVLRGGQALSLLALALLVPAFLGALVVSLLDALPSWMFWPLILGLATIFVLTIVRWLLTALIGAEGAGTFLGHALYDVVSGILRFPFRLLAWMFGVGRPHG